MAIRSCILLLGVACFSLGASEVSLDEGKSNPIRKVVKMLQSMQKKVTTEGEKAKELYDKYMCYCKTSGSDLAKGIADAEAKLPQLESGIKAAEGELTQTKQDLKSAQTDRSSAKTAMAEATSLREKESASFTAEKEELDANIGAMRKALKALESGMAGFLQTDVAGFVRKIVAGSRGDSLADDDRQNVLVFLSGHDQAGYAPQSGSIVGILKQMADEMSKSLAEATAAEKKAVADYGDLMAAKKKEIEALTKSIEVKTEKVGQLGVQIVQMKEDIGDTGAMLLEDKKFVADLEKNCATKSAEFDADAKARAAELTALAETIKILNDDDALELFKKTLPAPSFLQVDETSANVRSKALMLLQQARGVAIKGEHVNVDFIGMVLRGRKVGFDKVIKLIDGMVVTLKKEQSDDAAKKEYCEAQFNIIEDDKKALVRTIKDLVTSIKDAKEGIDTTKDEISALTKGIKALDKSVVEATEQRKEENTEYKELIAADAAAKEILKFAKNRLNKFYNPKLYKAPAKQELSSEGRIAESFSFQQEATAPPPAPEAPKAYSKKSEESTGVIAMIDLLIADLDKEMTIAKAEEEDGQKAYESFLSDSQQKRTQDSQTLTDKEDTLASLEGELLKAKEDKKSSGKELYATEKMLSSLHAECDWLLQYFDVRANARAGEIDALEKAKAVLSGADYSLVQVRSKGQRATGAFLRPAGQ